MCDHKLPVVEYVVANQVVEKLDDRLLELRAFFVQLLNGVGEPCVICTSRPFSFRINFMS
jgi:hypothetical protein